MTYYYVEVETRSHAFLLEQKLKMEGIECELTYMPREIVSGLCNMGVRFPEYEFIRAYDTIRYSGLPGWRIYKQLVHADGYKYEKIGGVG